MKHLIALILSACATTTWAQTVSNTSLQQAQPRADVQVPFRWNGAGTPTPIEWGYDLAWLSEDNVRRGMLFSGQNVVDIMRVSYMPSGELVNDKLTTNMQSYIKKRADLVKKYCKTGVGVNINDDHATVDAWYNPINTTDRAQRWTQVIDLTVKAYQQLGLNVVSVSPFNEPDYGWDQGYSSSTRKADFMNIAKLLRQKPEYEGIRLCGGNTLNCDQAKTWWDYLKTTLDEGNTHQLAGDFNHYADFFKAVRAYGHHATADELHNTMEAMVGVEYGMQTGIWWGTAERARGQYMKATYQGAPGQRLGYGEHRANWTAASIYRHTDGTVQAFIGSSERQAATTTYEFVSTDRDVYFNGIGPLRHYAATIPGGTGYQNGQTNAETVIDVQSGADVQPYIDGTYHIVNRYANNVGTKAKYLGFTKNPGTNWTQLQQNITPTNADNAVYEQWVVTPIDTRIGGDYSYYDIAMNTTQKYRIDILNWSLSSGGQVGCFPGGFGANEHWYLQYAGDNWFYIRSRHSNMALQCGSTSTGQGNVTQATFKEGDAKQMWRFLSPADEYDRVAPAIPTDVKATPLAAGVSLQWTAPQDADVATYDVLRAPQGTTDYNTIGRGITGTTFTDNTALDGEQYAYCVRAVDKALNRSELSEAVTAAVSGEEALTCHISFDQDLTDATTHGNHALVPDEPVYETKESNVHQGQSLNISQGNTYVQLPSTIASHDAITISCWAKRTSTSTTWERIWDFGNGTDQYMFLTPNYNGGKIRFAIKNGGEEQRVDGGAWGTGWKHVVVTIDADAHTAVIYVNGQQRGINTDITIRPTDINPVCNYLGRSQFAADPLLRGYLDEFSVFNYAMTPEQVEALYQNGVETGIHAPQQSLQHTDAPTYDLSGRSATRHTRGIVVREGNKYIRK